MKFEIMCKNSDTLKRIKDKLFKEIEMAFFLNLKMIVSFEDLNFSCKKILVESHLEEKTLQHLYQEWVILFIKI